MDIPEREPGEFISLDADVQFMLNELENVRSFLQEDTSIDERRMDVLILMISGVGAGFGLLAQAGVDHRTLLYIGLIVCATLPVITIPVFIDTVARDISAVDYIRAVNNIREFFITRTPSVQPYLLMPGKGPYPPYGGVSSNRRLLTVITSAALALLPLVGRLLIFHETDPDVFSVLVTLVAFALLVVVHRTFWRRQYRIATRDAEQYGSSALAKASRARAKLARRTETRERRAGLGKLLPWRGARE